MSDRLRELQRQRSLVQEQLAWLDREIAAAGGASAPPSPTTARSAPATPLPEMATSESTVAAEAIISKYKRETESLPGKVKLGCFIYFALAFLVVGLGVFALYLYTTRK